MMPVNMLTETDSQEEKLIRLLADINVCQRCVVRISRSLHGDYSVDESEKEVKKGSHCCTCLGILEGHTLYAVGKNIADKFEDSNYDSPTFHLGIAVPQCLILRQSSVVTYLCDNGHHNTMKEFTSVKNVAKMFLKKLIEKLTKKIMDPHSELFIKLDFSFPGDVKEISKLDSLLHDGRKGKKHKADQPYRSEAVQRVVKGLSDSNVKKYTQCPPESATDACKFDVCVYHMSIFIGGRYNKYSRSLSQTPWFVEGIRHGDTSTLELIGEKLKEFTRGVGIKFLSSGREDVDVRMLGKGRPFSVEIIDPKVTVISKEQMAKLQAEINSSTDMIAVRDLQIVDKAGLEIMKKGEEDKEKTYRAKLWCPEPISDELIEKINAMTDIELQQKTPMRVLHRRQVATRIRKVHHVELKRMGGNDCYELNLKTQAGTYIKEFVHGDFGRTEPSLRTLLSVPIDIVELDVMSIELNWPAELDNAMES